MRKRVELAKTQRKSREKRTQPIKTSGNNENEGILGGGGGHEDSDFLLARKGAGVCGGARSQQPLDGPRREIERVQTAKGDF